MTEPIKTMHIPVGNNLLMQTCYETKRNGICLCAGLGNFAEVAQGWFLCFGLERNRAIAVIVIGRRWSFGQAHKFQIAIL